MTRCDKKHSPMTIVRLPSAMLLGLFALTFSLLVDRIHAADVPVPDTTLVADPDSDPATDGKNPTRPDEQEKRIKVTAGLAALAGILIVGVVLGAVIIIWAGRLRRIVREPIPATGRQDPFWFLRPEKTIVSGDSDERETTNPESS